MTNLPPDELPAPTPPMIGELLDGVLRSLGAPPVRAVSGVADHWDEIAGPQLASTLTAVRLDDDQLVVEAPDSAWASQVRWQEADLLDRCEKVTGIRPSRLTVRVARH